MTLDEFFALGRYVDFLLLDEDVYVLPPGYKVSKNPLEKSNVVTMANGRKRKDIIRRWYKYSFAYESLLEDQFADLQTIVEEARQAGSIILYLRQQNPISPHAYESAPIDIVSPPKTSYGFRGKNMFVHAGITLEME